ncbi:MAG: SDR family NAD(P)-dependent oxidoreductase [Propionibacteriaceae bacterium]|jgi:NAD(P)-dependent dehydrogenase (short-subunit alcohol dehydrogenase family)/rhamnose utilization protein RhaD (predicted bifunctional aldolase and dehydrogenase)|nr:SDR family NAD(P)-dependent oxidoreductase [Propionibacteriaceae bacterium]
MSDPLTDALIRICHRFGGPEFARAGGGNASVKLDGVLHIKPSGIALATLEAEDLVPLRIDVLLEALHSTAPVEGDPVRWAAERARVGPAEGRRPSVEILFHALLPEALVLHLHPLAANAVTCNQDAHQLAARLLGDQAVVVDYIDPGVPLARLIDQARRQHSARTGQPAPGLTLLRNHGVIAAADSEEELIELVEHLTATVSAAIAAVPAPTVAPVPAERVAALTAALAPLLRGWLSPTGNLAVVTSDSGQLVQAETQPGRPMVSQGPLIPDQIVYAGALPCLVEPPADLTQIAAAARSALDAYLERHGHLPTVVVAPGLVAFAAGTDWASARNSLDVFIDSLQVSRDAARLGQPRTMTKQEVGFIEHWEAEAYRRGLTGRGSPGRLAGRVVVVTGAAQGFGLGLATAAVEAGAHVVLADLNEGLAQAEADRLSGRHGPGRARAVALDVADAASQRTAWEQILSWYGGVDLFVSNAGVARAGAVTDLRPDDFDLVTAINYRGYFLGVQAVAPIMAAQHRARPDLMFDIVEINSKSGLAGSKRNFAYAGSKFGGIGLTQSFALELVESGVKVNAICPGNFLDGPLWSDPERGLFVQYLRAGKVPGATSLADVRAYYEAQVPMGRGCTPADVAEALFYIVAQQYETGQAVPVTGGQIMMS